MKNFSENFQRKYRKMPKTAEERRHRRSEKPLPEEKSPQHRQIPPQPQLPPADAEHGEKPSEEQLRADQSPGQDGQPPPQRTQKIDGRAQDNAAEKAPQEPLPDHRRTQSRNPRFRPGSG